MFVLYGFLDVGQFRIGALEVNGTRRMIYALAEGIQQHTMSRPMAFSFFMCGYTLVQSGRQSNT